MYPKKEIEVKKMSNSQLYYSSRKHKYPLNELEVGDCFEIDRPEGEEDLPRPKQYATLFKIRSNVTYYTKTEQGQGKQFSCSLAENEEGKSVVVCYRTK